MLTSAVVGASRRISSQPEGLGINRGFMGALDCADLVQHAMPLLLTPLGKAPATVDAFHSVIQRREDLFGITKRISGTNRLSELKAHLDGSRRYQYTLDPSTRYASWHGGSPLMTSDDL